MSPTVQPPVLAAGAGCWRLVGGVAKILVVHRDTRADVSLPKGKLDPGEMLPQTAVREIAEETGLAIDVVGLAGYREMILPADVGARGRHFVILPFAAHWRAGDVVLNEELAEFQWLPPDRIDGLRTTEGLGPILLMAHRLALAGAEK